MVRVCSSTTGTWSKITTTRCSPVLRLTLTLTVPNVRRAEHSAADADACVAATSPLTTESFRPLCKGDPSSPRCRRLIPGKPRATVASKVCNAPRPPNPRREYVRGRACTLFHAKRTRSRVSDVAFASQPEDQDPAWGPVSRAGRGAVQAGPTVPDPRARSFAGLCALACTRLC